MPDIGDFIRRSPRSAKIAIAAPGTPGDFLRSRRSAYKIAKCVAGLKPATHLAILYADRGEFDRQRNFCHWLMRKHLAIFFADRGDVAVLKTHVIKSPNLMDWLYRRFAAMNVENRGNGHTWRMPANLFADIWHARYRRFYTPIAAIGENRNRCTGHTWRFSPGVLPA